MIDFTTLYNRHIDNLFAFGSRFSTDRELLKDCIQDVFVKLYTKRDALHEVDNLESYLYVSLRTRINDEYRRRSKMSDDEIDDAIPLRHRVGGGLLFIGDGAVLIPSGFSYLPACRSYCSGCASLHDRQWECR